MNWHGFERMARYALNNDAYFEFNSSDTPSILPRVDDTVMKFGNGTVSWDVWVYGNTASDYLLWDASASQFSLEGTAKAIVKGTFAQGSDATDRVTIKGFYMTPANVAVSVPSITDPDIARVQVDVSSAFSIQPAVGDAVIAIPQEALPTNARYQGAWVYQTDGIELVFGSEGGNVTGGAKNFKFLIIDLT